MAADPARPFCLTPTNWFITSVQTSSDDQVAYTKDGGTTWTMITDAEVTKAIWFARDAGGRVWALNYDANIGQSIYYSDDEGDTWTQSQAPTGVATHIPIAIFAHPTDQNRICVVTVNFASTAQNYITTDRGVTWTSITGGTRPKEGQSGVQYLYGFTWLQNGRMVAVGVLTTGVPFKWRVMYSDDDAATWTESATALVNYASNGIYLVGHNHWIASSKLVIAKQDKSAAPFVTTFLVSEDGGATWSEITPVQSLTAFISRPTDTIKDAVYDPTTDTMYVSLDATSTFEIVKFSPVTAAGVWTNITYNLGGFAPYLGGLDLIPMQ